MTKSVSHDSQQLADERPTIVATGEIKPRSRCRGGARTRVAYPSIRDAYDSTSTVIYALDAAQRGDASAELVNALNELERQLGPGCLGDIKQGVLDMLEAESAVIAIFGGSTADDAIKASVTHNRPITLDWTPQLAAALDTEAVNINGRPGIEEYLGEAESEHWCVELRLAAAS